MTTAIDKKYTPEADIYELPEAYEIELDMPGVSEEEVDVEIDRTVLTVSGGQFERGFTLGQGIDRDLVCAKVANGVLSLHLPKAKEAQPRKISISKG